MYRNKKNKGTYLKILMFVLFVLISPLGLYGQVYVSLEGNDDNPGTIEQPLKTIYKALVEIGNNGDTIYVRGGVYELFTPIKPERSGFPESKNCLWAYPGEKPVLDFSTQPFNSAARGIILARNHWSVKGFEIKGSGDNGIYITGDSNKVENCITYKCRDTGIQISGGGSYNSILNCDSYLNFDSSNKGENADGFAAKLDIGPGNEFKNCRAWSNSDDGWDMYESDEQVLIDSCWAFDNGYNIWGISGFRGDGNGFKLGGNYVPGNHIITNSVAFNNVSKGFDQNHNTAGITVLNCTGFGNERNFSFNENPKEGVHLLKNNLSYDGDINISSTSEALNNSWNGFFVSSDDFESIDTSLARIERDENFNIPTTEFLRLHSTSELINAGIDVGLPYIGSAPDIGAFEYELITSTNLKNDIVEQSIYSIQNFPNPFNPSTSIYYSVAKRENVRIEIFNSLGQKIKLLLNETQNKGNYKINFTSDNLSSGIYYYILQTETVFITGKMNYIK